MSAEFMFGVGRGKLSAREKAMAERTAKRAGVSFAGNPNMPGQGFMYWFTAKNLGEPFNTSTARQVAEALREAGWRRE
jgi:hypothetical protein